MTTLPKSAPFNDDKEPRKDPKNNKIFYKTMKKKKIILIEK